MNTLVKIDHGIPIPHMTGGRPLKYSWFTMEVGDSFFTEVSQEYPLASVANARYAPKRFTQRSVTEKGVSGIRVWRIA